MTKKQKILDAALHLFTTQGISETTTASIAIHADVATGTIFHHFENKKQLVEALYLSLKKELVASLPIQTSVTQTEQAFELWSQMIQWGLEHRQKFSFFTLYYACPWLDETFKENVLNDVFSFLTEFIDEHKKSGVFILAPTDFIAMHIQQCAINTVTYLLNNTEKSTKQEPDDFIRTSFETCMFGIKKG